MQLACIPEAVLPYTQRCSHEYQSVQAVCNISIAHIIG